MSIEQVVQSSLQENCLDILQLCFEEEIARQLHTYFVKNSLLKLQSLEYCMCLLDEYVNDNVNKQQKMENTRAKQGEWENVDARTSETETSKIDYINLCSEFVNSMAEYDNKSQ